MSENQNSDAEAQDDEKIREANEAIVALVREQKAVNDEKKSAMQDFRERLDDIQARMDGQIHVLDEVLRGPDPQIELPLKVPPPETVQAQDGSVLPGEEAFAIANGDAVHEPEDVDNVVPLREESVSSESFMADGMEHESVDDGTIPLDDDEIAMLTAGNEDDAVKHYQARTEASESVACEEVAAWKLGQQPEEPAELAPIMKAKRGRNGKRARV